MTPPAPASASGIATAAEPDTPPFRSGTSHEALLLRHGLITHVANVDQAATEEEVGQFARDASKVARNVIALAERRFGILLPPGVSAALSEVPHTLDLPGSAEPPPAATLGAPPPDQSVADPYLDESVSNITTEGLERPASPPLEPLDELETTKVSAGLDARLAALEARLDALSPDAIAARLETSLSDVIGRKIEATLNLGTEETHADARQAQDQAAAKARDNALARLESQVARIEAVAGGIDSPTIADLTRALAEIEEAIAGAFDAAGAARISLQGDLIGRLDALAARPPPQAPDVPGALEPLRETLESLADALDLRLARIEAQPAVGVPDIEAVIAPVFSALDSVAFAMEDRLRRIEGRPDPAMPDVSEALIPIRSEIAAMTNDFAARLTRIEARPEPRIPDPSDAICELSKAVAALPSPLSERIDALGETIEEQGARVQRATEAAVQDLRSALPADPPDVSPAIAGIAQDLKILKGEVSGLLSRLDEATDAPVTDISTALSALGDDVHMVQRLILRQAPGFTLEALRAEVENGIGEQIAALGSHLAELKSDGAAQILSVSSASSLEALAEAEARIAAKIEALEAAISAQGETMSDPADRIAAISDDVHLLQKMILRQAPGLTEDSLRVGLATATDGIVSKVDALQTALVDKGGLLGADMETAQSSMKRFWLASEEAVKRLDKGLGMLHEHVEALTRKPGTEDAREDAVARLAPQLDKISDGLDELREAAAQPAMGELRLLLAELLAGQARALSEA